MTHTLSPQELRAIHAKGIGPSWSQKLPFDRKIIKLLKNNEGNYEFFNKYGKKIYVGSSEKVKHRVESYAELDDPKVHPTKIPLRKELEDGGQFRFRYIPLDQARVHEQRIKQTLPFNMDSHENEIKKEKKIDG